MQQQLRPYLVEGDHFGGGWRGCLDNRSVSEQGGPKFWDSLHVPGFTAASCDDLSCGTEALNQSIGVLRTLYRSSSMITIDRRLEFISLF
jgi:hypothetical protein